MHLAYRSMNLESPCLMSFNDCSIFSLNLIFSYYLKLSLFFYYTGFWWLNTHTHVRSPLWEQSSLILSSSLTGIFLPLQVRLDAPQWLHSWQGATWCRLLLIDLQMSIWNILICKLTFIFHYILLAIYLTSTFLKYH